MYQCLVSDYDKLSKRIKSISKQIATYGYHAHFEELGREVKDVPVYKIDPLTSSKVHQYDIPMEVVNYDFYMPDFVVEGYSPIAVIHHGVIEGSNIKNKIDWIDDNFKGIPECQKWYNIDGHCDDCKDNYLRVKTVMMLNMETGEFRQIGMTCFKKYMGISSFNVIHNFMTVNEIIDEEPACYYTDGPAPVSNYVNTVSYLAHIVELIEKYGIIKDGKEATKEKAYKLCKERQFPSKEAVDTARKIINFFKNTEIDDVFGFDKDIKACVSTEYTRADGRFAYALARYNELNKKQEEHENQVMNSEYIGNIGDKKVVFELVLDKIFTFENNYYGYSTMYIMHQLGTENIVVWNTTTAPSIQVGDTFKASVTIKDHREYKGVKQTVVTRLNKINN